MAKIVYVLGVAFTPDNDVVLIEKKRPDWQAGKLNFVGGKLELATGELVQEAMRREFREETGVDYADWKRCAMAYGPRGEWDMCIYAARSDAFYDCKSMTDEMVSLHDDSAFYYLESGGALIENVATYYHFAKNVLDGVRADMRVYYG